ncbi:S-adenosylmethionine:tRNA ribosyltransferase-isomerase [Microlunatus speluncae]|uniref:S-adenosylmethionine:tRNA ribosyltransferase-isomerase n=1 Tax=Microlunatus speluncae TaxID=2594267 RepID=UPI0012666B5C|nr:S-adenosylmethionine:tRNA ribosyltransferase-isomerase [Microlunatus speluncae]
MSILREHPRTTFQVTDDGTAPEPPELRGLTRDGVRLLVARSAGIDHLRFRELGDVLVPGDLLVINNSGTLPGQLDAERAGHGPVVVHIANRLADGRRVIELRSHPDAAAPVLDGEAGEVITLTSGGTVTLIEPYPEPGSSPTGVGNRLWRGAVHTPVATQAHLDHHARPISYGYLKRTYPMASYQTVFALRPGSAEMPSAGRPFTTELVTRLISAGVQFAPITLHTTVSSTEAGEAPMPEWFSVPDATARMINTARSRRRRVIAVGTTATRAVESAVDPDGTVRPRMGWTDLIISPSHPVRAVSGLITGWHNPDASHLLLVEAVAGPDLTQRAYDAAVGRGYLWHEFGDSSLLLPVIPHRSA